MNKVAMSHEKENLAAGRLGTPGPQSGKAGRGKKAQNSYGVGRLGITPEDQAPPAPAPPPEPTPPPKPEKTEPKPGRTVSHAEVARILEPDRIALTRRGPSRKSPSGYCEQPPFGPRPGDHDKGRRRALIIAAVGGLMAVLLIVAFWASRGEESAPQSAQADPPPAPAVVPAPPVAPTGRDTRDLTNRFYKPSRQTPARDDSVAGPWMPTPPDRPADSYPIPDGFQDPSASSAPPAPPEPAPPAPAATQPAIIAPTGIEVTGILRGFGTPSAIINNHHVRVGESINGAKLLRIGEFAVEVEYEGKTFEIGVTSSSTPPAPPADEDPEEAPKDAE